MKFLSLAAYLLITVITFKRENYVSLSCVSAKGAKKFTCRGNDQNIAAIIFAPLLRAQIKSRRPFRLRDLAMKLGKTSVTTVL